MVGSCFHSRVKVYVSGLQMVDGFEVGERPVTPDERAALDILFSGTYEELRRLASSVRRDDPSATLSPTALVNEAWLKLRESPGFASTSRLHFKRIAARAMRQVLVEAARRRNAAQARRPAPASSRSTNRCRRRSACGDDLIALDEALGDLGRIQPRQAMMVESRFFGGLDIAETAQLLDVSEATILRDWRAAKAWLAHEVRADARHGRRNRSPKTWTPHAGIGCNGSFTSRGPAARRAATPSCAPRCVDDPSLLTDVLAHARRGCRAGDRCSTAASCRSRSG